MVKSIMNISIDSRAAERFKKIVSTQPRGNMSAIIEGWIMKYIELFDAKEQIEPEASFSCDKCGCNATIKVWREAWRGQCPQCGKMHDVQM